MPIGVGFDHCTDGYLRAHMFLHSTEVLAQGNERHFGPRRTSRGSAQNLCASGHFRDYSGANAPPLVTQGLPRLYVANQLADRMKFTVI